MYASSSEAWCGDSSQSRTSAPWARSLILGSGRPVTRSAPSGSGITRPPASVSEAVSFSRCWGSSRGPGPGRSRRSCAEMKSVTLMSASSRPRPITIRWSAVRAISLIRWRGDEDRAALGRQRLHQIADPEDALGVETVDRLVEEQHLRVAEQRGGDAEALPHAEREALGAPLGDVLQTDDAQHLVHPAGRDARTAGPAHSRWLRALPPAVHRLGVQQRAHLARCVRQLPVGVAADRHVARGGPVQAEDHPHGRGLARPVRTRGSR